jgi:peptide chain release factor 1
MISLLSTASTVLGGGFSLLLLESRPGFICFQVSGKNAVNAFKYEAGGHRWQRIPPTEHKGRRHTSTITVAVLREPKSTEISIDYNKLEVSTCRGSGPGGQHRNTTDSAVILKYENITVRCESERSQKQNKESAMALLRAKLLEAKESAIQGATNSRRKNQIGSGQRGDKVRTIRVFDNQVKDHRTNRKMKFDKYKRGFVDGLYR